MSVPWSDILTVFAGLALWSIVRALLRVVTRCLLGWESETDMKLDMLIRDIQELRERE